MNEHPPHLDRETAEELLGGATHGRDPLSRMLSRAAAPGRAHELSGEQDAVAAFHAARAGRRRRFSWKRLLTFKAIVAALAAATIGGLAYASTTGIIPAPFGIQSAPQPGPPGVTGSSHPGGKVSPAGPASATPSASQHATRGLCQAFLAKPAHERGKALDSTAFSALIEAAGGRDKVEGYCTDLLDEKPDKSHPSKTRSSR